MTGQGDNHAPALGADLLGVIPHQVILTVCRAPDSCPHRQSLRTLDIYDALPRILLNPDVVFPADLQAPAAGQRADAVCEFRPGVDLIGPHVPPVRVYIS